MSVRDFIFDDSDYIRQFNAIHYPKLFPHYLECVKPALASLETETVPATVTAILDELQQEIDTHKWKYRRDLVLNDARLISMLYLVPAAMEHNSEASVAFANELPRQWAERWPKTAFQVSTYERIADGFRTIFTIRKRKK